MSTVVLDKSFVVKITFKLKTSPYTTTDRYFCTQNFIDDAYTSQPTTVRMSGLLRDISGLLLSCTDYFPAPRRGHIVLDNTRGSTGHNKRFQDYLTTEEVNEQPVVIYAFEKPIGGAASAIFSEVEFSGIIKKATVAGRNQITLDVEGNTLERQETGLVMTETDFIFLDNAPNSIGRYLPMTFGTAQVPLLWTGNPTGGGTIDFAYARAHDQFPTGGITTLYAKKTEKTESGSQYVAVQSAAAASTAIYGTTLGTRTQVAPSYSGYAYPISVTTPYIITAVEWYLYINTSSGSEIYTWYIFDNGYSTLFNADVPGNVIAQTASLELDIFGSTGEKSPIIPFKDPVVLQPDRTYYIGFKSNLTSGYQAYITQSSLGTTDTQYVFSSNNYWFPANTVGEDDRKYWSLYGCYFDDAPLAIGVGPTGREVAYSYLGLEQITPDYGSYISLGEKLNLYADIEGMVDDGSGTITGVASAPLTTALDAVKFIYHLSGITLQDPHDAETTLETNYARPVDGAGRGRQFNDEIIKEICRQTGCFVYYKRDGSANLWAYGSYQLNDTIPYLSEQDCDLISWTQLDSKSVVNRVQLQYAEVVEALKVQDIQFGQNKSFSKTLDWYNGSTLSNATEIDSWTNDSFELYGDKLLSSGFTSCTFVRDDAHAEFLAKYYLTLFAKPSIIAVIRLPYWKKNFRTIECQTLIDLEHNDAPSSTGTSFDGMGKWPVYSGVEHTSITTGRPWREAKKYRCRVVSRSVNFGIGSTSAPYIDLVLKVIDNPFEIL